MNSEINNNYKFNLNNKLNNNLEEIKKDNCTITFYLPNLKVIFKKLFCL